MKLVKSANVKRTEDFIGAYVVIPKPSINSFVKKTADKFNLPVEIIGDEKKLKQSAELSKYKCRDSFPVPNALETIYSSRFFVTDSFHGVCFAIIFKKDFLVMPRDFMDRFTSLLDRLGLSDRIIKPNLSNLTDESFKPIDYNEVYKKLEKEVETSRALLSEALMNKPENKLSDLDVAMKYIRLQSQELAEMKTKIEQLEKLIKSSGATNSCPL